MKKLALTLTFFVMATAAHAVDVVITIPDAKFTNVRTALCDRGGYLKLQDENDVDGDGDRIEMLSEAQTCAAFAKNRVIDFIKQEVRLYNLDVKKNQARQEARTISTTDNDW